MSDKSELKNSQANPAETLVDLMLKRKRAALITEEQQRQSLARKDAAVAQSDRDMETMRQNRIKFCDHRKGTGGQGGRVKNPIVDYSVFFHTFVNRVSVVRCVKCGGEWGEGTTMETIKHYDGTTEPNFTGVDWNRALQMVSESTNQPSSAEIPFQIAPSGVAKESVAV